MAVKYPEELVVGLDAHRYVAVVDGLIFLLKLVSKTVVLQIVLKPGVLGRGSYGSVRCIRSCLNSYAEKIGLRASIELLLSDFPELNTMLT